MIPESAALARILESVDPLAEETLPLSGAAGRYASTEIRSPASLPRFDHSAMDGYALRAADASAGKCLRVAGEQPAGRDRELRVGPGECIRIFTGAPIPSGADAVVMQEDVRTANGEIRIATAPEPGEFIRRAGGDLCQGQVILSRGDRMNPQRIALLASLGIPRVGVHAAPKIAIISTGDELKPVESPLAPGELHESNSPMLAALITGRGFSVAICRHAADDPAVLDQCIQAASECDAVVLTGGVSVGEHDHVRAVLQNHGVQIDLWRVSIKPGKPFLFGRKDRRLYFGLPGNPVSTFVTALVFVLPGLARLAGAAPASAAPAQILATLASPVENHGDRPHYLRGALTDTFFHPAPLQESHAITSLARSNALARIEPHTSRAAGDIVPCLLAE